MKRQQTQPTMRPGAADTYGQPGKFSMVVVMGTTGSGKSYFINQLAGKEVTKEGNSLRSCTQGCVPIGVTIGGTNLLIIDTPGFDDAERPNSEILTEIARVLAAQYKLGIQLKGIVYVHRITDVRYTGSAATTFEICKRICGDSSLENVLLVTSRWSEIDEEMGSQREGELREGFWSHMLGRGSHMSRFLDDRDSAINLIGQLVAKKPIVLDLQRELVDNRKELRDTAAGDYVFGNLEELKRTCQKMLASAEEQKKKQNSTWWKRFQQAREQQDSMHRQVGVEVEKDVAARKWDPEKYLRYLMLAVRLLSTIISIGTALAPGVL